MKNITVFTLFVMMGVCLSSAVQAQEQKYRFTLGAEAGLFWGTSYEIVYNNSNSSKYLSELQWQIQPLWYLGFSAAFGLTDPLKQRGFFTDLDLKAGLPLKTGVIEDRDWFPFVDPSGSLTHFSSHNNKTTFAFLADLKGGYSFPVAGSLSLNVSLHISYMLYRFEAWNGYVQYGQYAQKSPFNTRTNGNYNKGTSDVCVPWNANWYKEYVSGKGVSYKQHWIAASPRAGLVFKPGRFTIEAALSVSPLSLCYAVDHHIWRSITFTEIMMPGLFFEPEGSAVFALNNNFSIGLEISYRHIGELRGNTQTTDENGENSAWIKGVAGAAYRAFRGAAIVRWTP
jgi:outer membrane protease